MQCPLRAALVPLGVLLISSSPLFAGKPDPPSPPSPPSIPTPTSETVFEADRAGGEINQIDFAAGVGIRVNTDTRKAIDSLAVLDDGGAIHVLVTDKGGVWFYEGARGDGQLVTKQIPDATGLSLDRAGNAYLVASSAGPFGPPGTKKNPVPSVFRIPRGGGTGGYGTPVLIDGAVPASGLVDTRIVPFDASVPFSGPGPVAKKKLAAGDLLVLASNQVLRYAGGVPGTADVFVPAVQFPPKTSPNGMAFSPNGDLLVTSEGGDIFRFGPDGIRRSPDFAPNLGNGLFKIAVGIQDGKSRAFVTQRNGHRVLAFDIDSDTGTGTLVQEASGNLNHPIGIGLASGKAAATLKGANTTVKLDTITSIFEEVTTAGLTDTTCVFLEDTRKVIDGHVCEELNLKQASIDQNLALVLPDINVPRYVRAFKRGDPDKGVPTFFVCRAKTTAAFAPTIEHLEDEEQWLGWEPACDDKSVVAQPRFFWAPITEEPTSEPAIVEGNVVIDVSTNCGSNRAVTPDYSIFLPAAGDERGFSEITDDKLGNLCGTLSFDPFLENVNADRLACLRHVLDEIASDLYRSKGCSSTTDIPKCPEAKCNPKDCGAEQAICHINGFIDQVRANPGDFDNASAARNLNGELISRATSAKFFLCKEAGFPEGFDCPVPHE